MTDIKFPETILDNMYEDMLLTEKIPNPCKEWMRKCMEEFPTSVQGYHITSDGRALPATKDVPREVTAWFNKYFSQFVEGA